MRATANDSLVLTVKQAADLLQCSPDQIYELIHRSEAGASDFPFLRLGERVIRIPREALQQWLSCSTPSTSDVSLRTLRR